MGFKHRHYLAGSKVYSCSVCRTHMATIESMISRRFNGQHGQAYLFDAVFNVTEAEPEERQMTTGLHRVRDISCRKCGQVMGWKYLMVDIDGPPHGMTRGQERAYEQSQKYKEGKSILEKALLVEAAPPAPPSDSDSMQSSGSSLSSSASGSGGMLSSSPPAGMGLIGGMLATTTATGSSPPNPGMMSLGGPTSPTVSPSAQLINVDTSMFVSASSPGSDRVMMSTAGYGPGMYIPLNRSMGMGAMSGASALAAAAAAASNQADARAARSRSSVSIRSVSNSEASEDSELAEAS